MFFCPFFFIKKNNISKVPKPSLSENVYPHTVTPSEVKVIGKTSCMQVEERVKLKKLARASQDYITHHSAKQDPEEGRKTLEKVEKTV